MAAAMSSSGRSCCAVMTPESPWSTALSPAVAARHSAMPARSVRWAASLMPVPGLLKARNVVVPRAAPRILEAIRQGVRRMRVGADVDQPAGREAGASIVGRLKERSPGPRGMADAAPRTPAPSKGPRRDVVPPRDDALTCSSSTSSMAMAERPPGRAPTSGSARPRPWSGSGCPRAGRRCWRSPRCHTPVGSRIRTSRPGRRSSAPARDGWWPSPAPGPGNRTRTGSSSPRRSSGSARACRAAAASGG
jgi:hypothetical protein